MVRSDEERLETRRVVEQIAAILEDRSDQLPPAGQRSRGGSRWARGGMLATLGLIGTGGSLALATIMQRPASDHRPAPPVGVVVSPAPRAPHVAAVAATTIVPQGDKAASVRIVKPPLVAHRRPSIGAGIPVRQEPPMAVAIQAPVEGQDAPLARLTGEALRLALIEDSAKTRALNLRELAQVAQTACRRPAQDRC